MLSIILSTADGYKWKYMYTLSASQQSNFLSTDFMAVSTNSTVSSAAVDGAINIVKIKTAGSGGADGTHTRYRNQRRWYWWCSFCYS